MGKHGQMIVSEPNFLHTIRLKLKKQKGENLAS